MSLDKSKIDDVSHSTPPRVHRKVTPSESEPVKVYLRVRPEFVESNTGANDSVIPSNSPGSIKFNKQKLLLALDDKTVRLTIPEGYTNTIGGINKRKTVEAIDDKIFTFDKVFHEDITQEEIYKDISSHAYAIVRGYNRLCLLATSQHFPVVYVPI